MKIIQILRSKSALLLHVNREKCNAYSIPSQSTLWEQVQGV